MMTSLAILSGIRRLLFMYYLFISDNARLPH